MEEVESPHPCCFDAAKKLWKYGLNFEKALKKEKIKEKLCIFWPGGVLDCHGVALGVRVRLFALWLINTAAL